MYDTIQTKVYSVGKYCPWHGTMLPALLEARTNGMGNKRFANMRPVSVQTKHHLGLTTDEDVSPLTMGTPPGEQTLQATIRPSESSVLAWFDCRDIAAAACSYRAGQRALFTSDLRGNQSYAAAER